MSEAGRQGTAEVGRSSLLDRWFELSERDTTLRTELVAGLTTFMTMAYIIFVNPQILSDAGIPAEAAFGATIYASVIATTLMGLWANFPVATAPGMGLKNAGIVVSDETNFVALGDLASAGPLLALLGLLLASFLLARGVKGAFIFSILATTIVSMLVGFSAAPSKVGDVFSFSLPDMSETFLAMDIPGALAYGLLSVLFTFTVVEVFDNLATFIGLTKRAGLMDENGKIPNINRAFTADAIGTLSSAALGSTAMNAYIENATGIEEGGRTGIQALVVGLLFLLALLFAPFVGLIPAEATAPVLVLVGALMLSEIRHIRFVDYTDVIPAFLTMFMMPLTFSIAEGLAFGFVSYTLLKVLTGRAKQVHWITYIISAAFVVNFWLLGR